MPRKISDFLTATDFYRYFQCPHWPYWERFGDRKRDRRKLTEAEERRLADGLEHEKKIVTTLLGPVKHIKIKNAAQGFPATLKLMQAGAARIYQGWLVDGDWAGRPDLLEKREGRSAFGDWHYVPVDIKRSHELKKEHKAQLTFYSVLLDRIQKKFPPQAEIVNGDGEHLAFDPSGFMSEFQSLTEALERIRGGEMPAPVYRKACMDTSPWGEACFRLAHERNDIALLFNVNIKTLASLRNCGVRSVEDAAELHPEQLEGQAPGLTLRALETIKRQARSLQDRLVIIRAPYVDVTEGLEIHFDIESHPPSDRDYLYGFLIRDGSTTGSPSGLRPSPPQRGGEYKAFLAEKIEDEEKMWGAFLAWLPTLPADYTVYHYANYERMRLGVLAKRYGDEANPWLEKFKSRLVDVKEIARDQAVFPLYFYSLKTIGKFLGFAWKGDVTGGADSVIQFEKWRKTKQRSILNSILQYNEEDVRATAFLLDWLREYAQQTQEYQEPYPWK